MAESPRETHSDFGSRIGPRQIPPEMTWGPGDGVKPVWDVWLSNEIAFQKTSRFRNPFILGRGSWAELNNMELPQAIRRQRDR